MRADDGAFDRAVRDSYLAIYSIRWKAVASQPGTLRDGQAWLDDDSGNPGGCP
jgi:hypothetical protein